MKLFMISMNKGFHLPLPNEYSVSVQFGSGNYCEHYLNGMSYDEPTHHDYWQSKTAETAITDPAGNIVEYQDGYVQGHQTPEDVWKTIQYAASLTYKE